MSLCAPLIAGLIVAVLIGLSVGLLGGGGSILTLPILVYAMGVPAHEAIALSLLVVGAMSLAALAPHARAGNVRWRMGTLLGAASMAGAYGAGRLAHRLPESALLLLLGGLMLVSAVAMMRGRASAAPDRPAKLPVATIAVAGAVIGALTGLVGAGGGFLFVPALILLGKLPVRAAVGTSLLVVAMKSFAGLAGCVERVSVDWPLAATVTGAAVVGSVAGGALACRVPRELLRRGFAWFVVVMAVFVLVQEVPRALGAELELASAWPLVLGASALPIVLAVLDLARRARLAAA